MVKEMQAVILAAGESSRFKPLSEGKHKSLLKVMGKTLAEWTAEAVLKSGIKDIIIVSSPKDEKEFKNIFKSNKKIRIVIQKKPLGSWDAIQAASKYINSGFFLLNAADRFDADKHIKILSAKQKKTKSRLVLLACKTSQPWKFGILEIKGDKAISIVEKPAVGKEPSNFRVVSTYLLPKEIFSYLNRSGKHQNGFEEALQLYIKENDVRVALLDKDPASSKYPWELLDIASSLLGKIKKHKGKNAKIGKNVVIEGNVFIGDNVKIFENAIIKGPCHIGDNCVIGNNALVRESVLENNAQIGANTEIARSVLMENTHIHSGFLGDSVIGENCRIGAGFVTGNRRIDRKEIDAIVKGEKTKTGRTALGIIIGHNTKIGIKSSSMPGTIVGSGCIIGSNTQISGNVDSGTTVYSKFEMIVEKKTSENKKIVCIGGGNAMPNAVLSELKNHPFDITTITSMTDSGGSTGALRKEFNVHPAGDLRRHILALSSAEEWKKKLWKFRFANDVVFEDGHKGHNFANTFMAGLEQTSGDFEKTLEISHDFMKVRGQCLPSTMEIINLFGKLENGKILNGEHDIDVPDNRDPKLKIEKIWIEPEAKAYPKAVEAILEADIITIGPGDLYSSLLPCFLPKGIKEAFASTKAKKILIVPAMTKFGETYGFSVEDFAKEVEKYLGSELSFVIFNTNVPAKGRIENYKKANELLADVMVANGKSPQKKFIGKDLLLTEGSIEFDPKKVMSAILGSLKH